MTKDQINNLHHLLVQTIIDYINKEDIKDLEEVSFNADNLQTSAQQAIWCPCTDSYLCCEGYKVSEDLMALPERYIIGESY